MRDLTSFIIESNAIEGIWHPPTEDEIKALDGFLTKTILTVESVENLCKAFQPDAELRDRESMNVMVGDYAPPLGGARIPLMLSKLLTDINMRKVKAFDAHVQFESIHPFTDGNGRTGRAIWLWQMTTEDRKVHLPFLHHWYYQTLEEWRNDGKKAEESARIFATEPE